MRNLEKVLAIPFIFGVAWWLISSLANPASPQVIQKGGELVAQAVIPWWIPVLQFLAGFSPILAVVFLFMVFKSNTARG